VVGTFSASMIISFLVGVLIIGDVISAEMTTPPCIGVQNDNRRLDP